MTQIRRIPCGTVNCYLISSPEGAVLVDTGRAGYGEKILDACTGAGVRLILPTHGHLDHTQNTAFLMERLGVPAAIHRAGLNLLEDDFSQPLSAHTPTGRLLLKLSLHSFRTQMKPPFTPTVFLEDGDSLAPWGIEGKILALPGHTAGSIAVDVEGRDCVVGDAMMSLPRPSPALLYTDRARMLESVERLRALGPRTLYFGHGRPEIPKIKNFSQKALDTHGDVVV